MNVVLPIEGMHCAACARTIERAIRATGVVEEAAVNYAAETAAFSLRDAGALPSSVIPAIEAAGYRVRLRPLLFAGADDASEGLERDLLCMPGVVRAAINQADGIARIDVVESMADAAAIRERMRRSGFRPASPGEARDSHEGGAPIRLLFAVSAGVVVMLLAMQHMIFHHPLLDETTSGILQLILTIPIHLWCGWEFHRGIWRFLLRRQSADMNALISLGTNASFIVSVTSLVSGTHALYFESVSMITAVVLLGRWLEYGVRKKARISVDLLASYRPSTAVVARNGAESIVPTDELVAGDVVYVEQGKRIPADGIVVSGGSAVDESTITGESLPVDKTAGSRVVCGTLNLMTPFRFRVEKAGGETLLARVAGHLLLAQGTKTSVQRLADRVSAVFVPLVILIAAVTFAGWMVSTSGDVVASIAFAVSVLVVSCPCALGLATPAAVVAGIGWAARKGILIREASVIERVGTVNRIVLDKTGTLTEGTPSVDGCRALGNLPSSEIIRAAAVMEKGSVHPVGRAICRAAGEPIPDPRSVEYLPGLGVKGIDDRGRSVLVGNEMLMEFHDVVVDQTPDDDRHRGKSVVHVAVDGTLAGAVVVTDSIRRGAEEFLRASEIARRRVSIISGDHPATVGAVAERLGIREHQSGVMPQDKSSKVEEYRARGDRVMMVGDGVNDAPALLAADVGVAVGGGTDVAIASADVVIMRSDLRQVAHLFDIAGKTVNIIRQNLIWAFGYNVLLIPVAAGVLSHPWGIVLTPMMAAAAMSISSLVVVTNAARLALKK